MVLSLVSLHVAGTAGVLMFGHMSMGMLKL
jgi:hypothetical protein